MRTYITLAVVPALAVLMTSGAALAQFQGNITERRPAQGRTIDAFRPQGTSG